MSTLPAKKSTKKQLIVNQSNELTEAAYYLPLQGKRVLWMCLADIAPFTEVHDGVFTVAVANYSRTFGVSLDTAGKHVKQGVTQLLANPVWFYRPEDEVEETGMPWLYKAGNRAKKGLWSIRFHPDIMPYVVGLKDQYTSYNIVNCGELKNTRHIRLYESLSQFKHSGYWTVKPEWICERFKLPASQRNNMGELKRRFLDPALKIINTHTPLEASYKTTSVKGKISRFEFFIKIKENIQELPPGAPVVGDGQGPNKGADANQSEDIADGIEDILNMTEEALRA